MAITDITSNSDILDPDDLHEERLLLMPPPRRFNWNTLSTLESDWINHLLRLSFFFAKITSLIQPCSPYIPNLQIAFPLIFFAAVDLISNRSGGTSILLVMIHAFILWFVRRDFLCPDQWPNLD